MKLKGIGLAALILLMAFFIGYQLLNPHEKIPKNKKNLTILNGDDDENMETSNSQKRARYEWLLLRDPKTGKIPEGIRSKELTWVRTMPIKRNGLFSKPSIQSSANGGTLPLFGESNNYNSSLTGNSYIAAGPAQNGGRTRAVAYDSRYGTGTNKIILAGGINGGIFRSTDGGVSWKFVHPPEEARNISCLAQNPINKDTWYAGTGEPIGASSSYPSAFVYGNGILKSTDGGATWSKLASTNVANTTTFQSQWNFIHKLAVHPITGDVYAAIHRRIVRSTDGGNTWTSVFESSVTATGVGGIGDLIIKKDGSAIIVAMTGRNPDRNLAGIFISTSGNKDSYTRIAGGVENAADSVAGWKAYDLTPSQSNTTEFVAGWGRIVLATAPSNENILYTLVENSETVNASKPEADLFKCDMSNATYKWTKLTDNLVAKRISGATTQKYFEGQNGYNMLLAVQPTNDSVVFVGGVNLFRSTDGFSTKTNVTFAGGIDSDTYTDVDNISHADNHSFSFDPTNSKKVLIGSDGGLAFIEDVTQTKPNWINANSQYQSLQYYHVGVDPTPGSRVFFGGAQDNSTTFRDINGLIDILPDSNDHYILLGGDGCQVGLTKKNSNGQQHLFCAAQSGQVYRLSMFPPYDNGSFYTAIKPSGAGEGEFITYFHLDQDNTDYMYYVSEDSIFRTAKSTAVTPSTWTLMTGVAQVVSGSIFSIATTRGAYTSNSHLYIGTSSGKIYRMKDPQGASVDATPKDITPVGMSAGVVTDISVNSRNQDTVIAVVSNYGVNSIFWTGNATATKPTWQVIEGNLTVPSVRSCEIVVKTTGVEYYVGTSTGLFSTSTIAEQNTVWSREVGTSSQPSVMMNTAIVNSLAYRWSDNTLVVGTHGNGMFVAYIGNATISNGGGSDGGNGGGGPVTAITEPIRNDDNFIRNAYPTIVNDLLQFQTGNMSTVKKLNIQVTSINGAVVYQRVTGYENGRVPLNNLMRGTYILTITSSDRKYQYTKKIIKN